MVDSETLIGYARVSTNSQNLNSQLSLLEESGCKRIFKDVYTGKTARNRTELSALLDFLRPGDIVVVTKLDRLSRSLTDLLKISDQIHSKGAELRSLSEDFDTTKSMGKLIFHVMGVLAEFERSRISERTKEGLRAARERGRVGGRPRVLTDRHRDLVMKLREQGDSLRDIASMLNVAVGTVQRVIQEESSKL